MQKDFYIKKQYNTDIEILTCGFEDCEKNHFFGPAVRDVFLIHYVVNGKGIFRNDKNTYNLKKGDGFLICPKQLTYYEADSENPWEYIWIGFTGVKADELLKRAGISEECPVFENEQVMDCFKNMIGSYGKKELEIILLSELYRFFSILSQQSTYIPSSIASIKQQYVSQAIQYIKNNYINNINIIQISNKIGLNRSYFYEIFKNETGISPQQYLITYRIDIACRLLLETNLRISDIAHSVGYEDEFMFTRMFKNKIGLSPTKYKKQKCVQQ